MRCLNLKITYECPNHCSFCLSSYLRDSAITIRSLKEAVIKGHARECDELVLSGGEPTLYPDYIKELVSLAESLGYKKYIIQTNGYGLSKDASLVSFLDEIGKAKDVCLSFSVHGHTAEKHNQLSRNSEAFTSLMDAINVISGTNCHIYTNTVVNSLNVDFLQNIATMLLPYKPDIMQFSMMHLKKKSELAVSLIDSVMAIKGLRMIVNLDTLKTEGIPFCLLHGMEQCVGESAWPTVLDLFNKDSVYISDFKQLDYGMRSKMELCEECIMNKICMGVWKEHFKEFSNMGIRPIA